MYSFILDSTVATLLIFCCNILLHETDISTEFYHLAKSCVR